MYDQLLDINVNNAWISKLDRGGLKYPHPDVVCVTTFTYVVVKKLISSNHEDQFLLCQNQRCVVCNVVLDVLDENEILLCVDDCENGHNSASFSISLIFRNIFKEELDSHWGINKQVI